MFGQTHMYIPIVLVLSIAVISRQSSHETDGFISHRCPFRNLFLQSARGLPHIIISATFLLPYRSFIFEAFALPGYYLYEGCAFFFCEDLSVFFGFSRQWGACRYFPMSVSQHGNMDPSSTDKGAADEIDKVDLEVLCLTGEGVTLSVPRSMLGYDLRRLVSEKLPCKPGAKLAVHHANRKLTHEPWESKRLLENRHCLALTYRQMCTVGVMPMGSQLVREILC